MRVRNHRLVDEVHNIDFIASSNIGGRIEPRYLVIHYTAGTSAVGCIDWFSNPSSKASAHLVIARDGAITQMGPFNRLAQHAGKSEWGNPDGLNRHSIGIELDNAGQLMLGGGQWVSPVSRRTTAELNVRSGAGTEFSFQPGSPLPAGPEVEVLSRKGVWWQVDAAGAANGTTDMVGWLSRIPCKPQPIVVLCTRASGCVRRASAPPIKRAAFTAVR